ncbi:DUF1127 domain-containing protein [Amphritea japonica]|uniref:DUF1127 domain-containing protein n=1 Tax=Amphritea japonica TaxID=452627 RepID=UPI0003A2A022|nr:DUF1127 domain-containing protein [Amphritea japonica]
MKKFIRLAKQYRETYYSRRLLRNLDAHALKDIDLSRADALHEAKRPFWDNKAHQVTAAKKRPHLIYSAVSLLLIMGVGLTIFLRF